ncbi:hypothetical protein [Hymenobacter chitinivorans]|uniref:Outer membrane protein with beta-barrel domain n=1 Tax=Hymenobacter chitinivorans DSM 11115 TaxID=1121954 RepID=A0A2M9BRU5_9BACT|nr:hypothetical protein [Hymenobacter chitinivorans]PJJ60674.1 hypothetical protein CLV45_2105 [Hymenobacter chitinivorans DSM 11115]
MRRFYGILLLTFPWALPSAFGQKGGYKHLDEPSFTGAPALSLSTEFLLSSKLVGGVVLGAARQRQAYQELVTGFMGGGGRQITEYHNYLYSLEAFLAYRLPIRARLQATLGLGAGRYVLGARERSDRAKWGAGIWSALTYRLADDSRFSLEARLHPQLLLRNGPAEDSNYRFNDSRQFVWDGQVGISYNLRKQP